MRKNILRTELVLWILLLTASIWLTTPALMQGPIVLDGVAGYDEWDPGWQVTIDPLDVFKLDTGTHPHDAPTYARSGYDATGLWAHYQAADDRWYFRLDVDGRVADSDSQTGTASNLGVGTHDVDQGPLGGDSPGIGLPEAYRLRVQYQNGGVISEATLGGDSAILPGVLAGTTGDLTGQGIYSTTFNPGIVEWAIERAAIFPTASSYEQLWLSAQIGDNSDLVSDDNIGPVLVIALDQSIGCPVSPAIRGYQATFTAVYTVPATACLGATGVTLTVTVPAETTFISAGDGGIESGGLITWNLGDLSPGNTGQLTFTLYIDSAVSALTLGSEMVSTEGLRHQTSSECQAQEPYHVYLPMMSRNYPTITVLTAEIPAQPIQPVTLGETFYSAPLTLIETVPAGGRFYLSNHPDGIAPIWVDDQLALVKNDSDIFTFTFSDGENVHAAIVEVPRTIVESIAAGGVTLEYRDVYGVNGSSSAVWLIWVP